MERQIILALDEVDERLVRHALSRGIKAVYCDPEKVPRELRGLIEVYHESENADRRIVRSLQGVSERVVPEIVIKSPEDAEKVLAAARAGAKKIIVKVEDWKIIALENLIADLTSYDVELIAAASSPMEIETLASVLEKGVDGILVQARSLEEVDLIYEQIKAPRRLELVEVEVVEVREVGLGDRACIDTTSILSIGEGMLIGNTSSLLTLVHNESLGSAFTAPRPFRVNAGAIHSYVLMPDNTTRYLSELKAGDRVLIVSRKGTRLAAIGRVKIERRPLKLIKLEKEGIEGSVTLQDAETISLVTPGGEPISVAAIKPGDKVLAHIPAFKARHFGRGVEEFLIER